MGLGTDHVTPTSLANAIPNVWTRFVRMATTPAYTMAKLVFRADEETKGGGKTLEVPHVSNLSANTFTEGSQVTLQQFVESKTTFNINRRFESSFVIQDMAKVQSSYNYQRMYTDKAANSIMGKIDSDLTGLYSGLTQDTGSGNTALTLASFVGAIEFLDTANAPQTGRAYVGHPNGFGDLRQIAQVIEFQTYGDQNTTLKTGVVKPLHGIQMHMTTNVTQLGSPSVTYNLLFQKEFALLAIQIQPRVQMQYKQEYLGTLVTVDTLYAYGEMRDEFGVAVLT